MNKGNSGVIGGFNPLYYGLVRRETKTEKEKVITFYDSRLEAEFFLAILAKKGANYKIEEVDKEGKRIELYA